MGHKGLIIIIIMTITIITIIISVIKIPVRVMYKLMSVKALRSTL